MIGHQDFDQDLDLNAMSSPSIELSLLFSLITHTYKSTLYQVSYLYSLRYLQHY